MRSNLVVVTPPLLDADLGFDAIPKPVQAQILVPKLAVERFVGEQNAVDGFAVPPTNRIQRMANLNRTADPSNPPAIPEWDLFFVLPNLNPRVPSQFITKHLCVCSGSRLTAARPGTIIFYRKGGNSSASMYVDEVELVGGVSSEQIFHGLARAGEARIYIAAAPWRLGPHQLDRDRDHDGG